jgi:hypothetical protein
VTLGVVKPFRAGIICQGDTELNFTLTAARITGWCNLIFIAHESSQNANPQLGLRFGDAGLKPPGQPGWVNFFWNLGSAKEF